jgi:hypothetical protein
MKVGNESVVIGQIKVGATIGDRSVVIGATDSFGNATIREGAYGYGAKAAPGSVAIGANAEATTSNKSDIDILRGLVEALEKGYLMGRYGAVPFFRELPSLLIDSQDVSMNQ